MNMNELQNMIKVDSKVDITKLDTDSVEAPYVYGRYITIHATEKAYLLKYKKDMKVLFKEKTAYYRGDADPEIYEKNPLHISILKSQVPGYVESDSGVQNLQEKIDIQEIKVDMISDFIYNLRQKTFHIKNAIEFMKFKNGLI